MPTGTVVSFPNSTRAPGKTERGTCMRFAAPNRKCKPFPPPVFAVSNTASKVKNWRWGRPG